MAIKDLFIKIGLKGDKKAKKGINGLAGAFGAMSKAAMKAAAVFYAAKGIITGIQKTIEVSSKLTAVENGFRSLEKGIKGTGDTLKKLQKATDGTVNSIDLMTQANNAMLLGVFESNDQMAEAFDVAQRLGAALGQDTLFGVESLVTGMGRQSKLMLDNLGIMVDVEEANKRHAETLGKSSKELTDQEKKAAFNNETMRQAKLLVESLGEEQLTTSDRINILKSSTINMAGVLGKALTPAFNASLDVMSSFSNQVSNAVNTLSKLDFAETGKNIIKSIDALLTAVGDSFMLVFDGVPEYFSFAFSKILPIAKSVLNTLVGAISGIATFIWEPISIGARMLGVKIQNFFIDMFNGIKEQFNIFAESFLGEKLGIEKLEMTDLVDMEGLKTEFAETDIGELFFGEDQVQTVGDLTSKLGGVWGDYFNKVAVLAEESGETVQGSVNKIGKAAEVTGKKVKEMSLEQAISVGQSSESVKGAIRSVIKAKFASMMASMLEKEIGTKGLVGLITGAAGAAAATALFDKLVPKFADGGIVGGAGKQDTVPAMLTPGEVILNQAQQENLVGGMGTTINIQGGVVDESYVNNQLIPALNKATSLGTRLNA
tara:strand:- start:11643 stop:13445 length:1803 start_codon:yes stop_codon:yes gene_type:complete